MAGALLFEKIIQLAQTDYSCQDDRDFPFISLVSYPFAEMLKGNIDANLLKFQMAECFQMFIDQGVSLAAIACNTLHAFCPPIPPQIEFLHLIRETATHLEKEVTGDLLVLSSTTSKNNHLYNRCLYPKRDLQTKLDQMIDRILGGSQLETESRRLASWLNEYPTATIVLGCTEFSLLNERTP
ncbi:MAG: aspartate/glutamate racemase family protein, partial [Verrucomicrobiota bacterium]|nr:aspartate/glutamate racemase family protein [Verrucomicrobiota bacterium]